MSFKITFLEFGSPLHSSSVTERHRVVTDRAEGRWAKQAEAEAEQRAQAEAAARAAQAEARERPAKA